MKQHSLLTILVGLGSLNLSANPGTQVMTPHGLATAIVGKPLSPHAKTFLKEFCHTSFSTMWIMPAFAFAKGTVLMTEALALEVLDMPKEEKNDAQKIQYYHQRRSFYLHNELILGINDNYVRLGLRALQGSLDAARHCLLHKTSCVYAPEFSFLT